MEMYERTPLMASMGRDAAAAGAASLDGRLKQFAVTFLINMMALTFGMGMGWSSTELPLLMAHDSPLSTGPITKDDASWLASILCIMGMFTTPIYHYVSEHFGRRFCGYLTVIPGIISISLLIYGKTLVMVYISRALIGACFAGTFIYCPVYITEIAEKEIRGSMGVVIMLMRNIGILLSYILGSYLSYYTFSWIFLIPPLIFVISLLYLPESPVYLVRQGKYEESMKAMKCFRSKNAKVEDEIIKLKFELSEMQSGSQNPATFLELMRDKTARKALMITFVLFCNQQLCGFYAVVSYSVMIFQESGNTLSPNICSIIVGIMLLMGTVFTVVLCDLTGRKILLVISDSLMALSLAIISLYFYAKAKEFDVTLFHWVPVTCLSIYVIALNIGLSSLPVLIATELFSPRFTSLAMTITAPSTWFLTFVVAKYFPLVSDHIGIHGSAIIFAAVCLAGTFYIIFYLPETKNKSLINILEELNEKEEIESHYRNLYGHKSEDT